MLNICCFGDLQTFLNQVRAGHTSLVSLYDWFNNFCCFSVVFMALAVDVIDGRGPSNEMCHQLQPKKVKLRLY